MLDRQRNDTALLFREGLQAFAGVIEGNLRSLVEIAERERLEAALQRSIDALDARVAERTRELEDANTALRVLLANIDHSRREHDEEILREINTLVTPHLSKLARFLSADSPSTEYLHLVETSLQSLTSTLSTRIAREFEVLTMTETEIAQLIMHGKTTKQIAKTLSRSTSTVDFHRNNIRAKLGLRQGQNLRAYLLSMR